MMVWMELLLFAETVKKSLECAESDTFFFL